MGEILCSVQDVAKRYGQKAVLEDVSFDIEKGEIIGVVGKSGAGKSTLMNIIAGILSPSKGRITFTDKRLDRRGLKKTIGYSFQPYSLYPELTLEQNICYFASLYGLRREAALERARRLFELTDLSFGDIKLAVDNLSGGMKKRFDIVVSLLHNPQVLMLDEPTAGLDPLRRKDIMAVMRRISAEGVTIIVSSHIMSDLEPVCDRILVLHDGKRLVYDEPSMIKSELLDNELIKVRTLPGNYGPIIEHLRAFNIVDCEVKDSWLYIYTPESEILVHYVLDLLEEHDETIDRIVISEPDLGELFEKLQGSSPRKALKEHVLRVRDFVYDLVGKKMSREDIKKILESHRWPVEVVDALVSREMKAVDRRR